MRKPMLFRTLAFFLIMLSGIFIVNSQAQATASVSAASGTQLMPLSAVKEGMRGTARTVFQGSNPEEFKEEFLGVLPRAFGPKQDVIIGRLSGAPAERTGVF